MSWWRGQSNILDDWDSNNGAAVTLLPLGGVTYSTGKVGLAFSSAFTVEDAPSLRLTNGLTIEAWVLLNSTFDNSNHVILSKYAASSDISYLLGCTNRTLYLHVSASGSLSNSVRLVAPQPLPLTTWVHVAGTYDGSGLNLFTNGDLVATTGYSDGIHAGFANVGIGKVPLGATSATNGVWFWRGLLDEVSLYNRALSAAELQAIVNADSAGKCLTAPAIIEQPLSQSIPQLEDVMFRVKAVGAKPFSYRWTSNGIPIFLPPQFFSPLTSELLIEKIGPRSGIAYAVSISNSLGHVTSSNAILTVLPANSCTEAPLGIVDWWPGDTNGTDFIDSLDAQSTSGGVISPGKVGNGFSSLDPGPGFGPIWSVPNGSNLNFSASDSFSVEAWVQVPSKTGSGSRLTTTLVSDTLAILSKDVSNPAGSPGYSLFLDRGRFCCTLKTASSSNTFSSFGPDVRDDMFHHVALTLQRDATNGGVMYVDGQPILVFDTTPVHGQISNAAPLVFFAAQLLPTRQLATSMLDEPSLYRRALSADEVLAIRNAGAAGKCKTKPIIQVQPANQTVPQNTDATFAVVAHGTPYLRYQWSFRGTPIPGATETSLTISNASPSQSGLYSVTITNKLGVTVSHNAVMNLFPVAICSNAVAIADSVTCMASVSIDAGSYDPDGPSVTVSQVPPGPYPLGMTSVTLIAVDNLGASNSCTATVTVLDRTPPQIVCPTVTAVANDLHQCGAVVRYPLPTATDSCSAITNLICNPPPGSFFPVGMTPVNCTATDAAGNFAQCTFNITVLDSEPPAIVCPSDIIATNAHDAWTSQVTFNISVTDNCGGAGPAVATPPSGSAFPVGTNQVSCVSTDAVGNVAHCSFNVIVLSGNQAPVPVIEISPLAHFPGWTNNIIIAPRGIAACVRLDGSQSFDPDGDPFSYQWSEGTNTISTNATTRVRLVTGTHEITLSLDDHLPLGTNSASLTLEVITPADAVMILIAQLQAEAASGGLPANRLNPLIASLRAVTSSFERGNYNAGQRQLAAFETKARVQLSQPNPDLAESLVTTAEMIADAVDSSDTGDCNAISNSDK